MIRATLIATLFVVGLANADRPLFAPKSDETFGRAKIMMVNAPIELEGTAPPPPPLHHHHRSAVKENSPNTEIRAIPKDKKLIGKVFISFYSEFKASLVSGELQKLPKGNYSIEIHMAKKDGELKCDNVEDDIHEPEKEMMDERDIDQKDVPFGKLMDVEVKDKGDTVEIFKVKKWIPKEHELGHGGVVGLSLVIIRIGETEDGSGKTEHRSLKMESGIRTRDYGIEKIDYGSGDRIFGCAFIKKSCTDKKHGCTHQDCKTSSGREKCPEKCNLCPGKCKDMAACGDSKKCHTEHFAMKCPETCGRCLDANKHFTE